MRRRSSSTVLPGRFQLHGLEVEVEPEPEPAAPGWRARVVPPPIGATWHHGRHAWGAIDAAVIAHLASAPADETYRRLLAPGATDEAGALVAA